MPSFKKYGTPTQREVPAAIKQIEDYLIDAEETITDAILATNANVADINVMQELQEGIVVDLLYHYLHNTVPISTGAEAGWAAYGGGGSAVAAAIPTGLLTPAIPMLSLPAGTAITSFKASSNRLMVG